MRVMTIVKATEASEAGRMPTEEELNAMGKFNAELVDAGVMVAGDGLKASKHGVRISYQAGDSPKVVDGPFAETKELVSGFWILEVASLDEAVAWLQRAPFGPDNTVELRPIVGPEDFGGAFTPEMQEAEDELRKRAAEQHGA